MTNPKDAETEYITKRDKLLLNIEEVCFRLDDILEIEEKLNLDPYEVILMQALADSALAQAEALPVRKPTYDDLKNLATTIETCNSLVTRLNIKQKTINELSRKQIDVSEILSRKKLSSLILGNIDGHILRLEEFVTMTESKDCKQYELPIKLIAAGIAVPRNAWLN